MLTLLYVALSTNWRAAANYCFTPHGKPAGWTNNSFLYTKVKDTKKVANYVLKYITKDMIKDIKNRKRYWVSRNLDKIEEHTYLIDYGNYDDTVTDLLAEFVKRNKSVHFHDFFLDHVDFQNKISYFKYDRNICDVEFSSILQI